MLLCAFLPPCAPDALEGPGQTLKACSRTFCEPMRNAIDRYGAPSGRVGVVEAEQGDHPVDVDEQ